MRWYEGHDSFFSVDIQGAKATYCIYHDGVSKPSYRVFTVAGNLWTQLDTVCKSIYLADFKELQTKRLLQGLNV